MMNTPVQEKDRTYTDEKKKERGHDTHHVPKEEIALRAYQIWQEHGCTHGHDHDDWRQAEHELHGHV